MKDRDDAWNRVEELAMKHPNFNTKTNNKPFMNSISTNPFLTDSGSFLYSKSPPIINNSPPNDDIENKQNTALCMDKIETKTNEVSC